MQFKKSIRLKPTKSQSLQLDLIFSGSTHYFQTYKKHKEPMFFILINFRDQCKLSHLQLIYFPPIYNFSATLHSSLTITMLLTLHHLSQYSSLSPLHQYLYLHFPPLLFHRFHQLSYHPNISTCRYPCQSFICPRSSPYHPIISNCDFPYWSSFTQLVSTNFFHVFSFT